LKFYKSYSIRPLTGAWIVWGRCVQQSRYYLVEEKIRLCCFVSNV
jgi:hypothetical protein